MLVQDELACKANPLVWIMTDVITAITVPLHRAPDLAGLSVHRQQAGLGLVSFPSVAEFVE